MNGFEKVWIKMSRILFQKHKSLRKNLKSKKINKIQYFLLKIAIELAK